ncbi:MAG: hypothetical protein H9535_05460 [Ignavibacteria bacterium]|nr:hypothetical protein [Ignavibacteria bacterium]
MPTQAKTAQKPHKRRKKGSLKEAKMRLWAAIERTTTIIENERQPETVLRAVHALSQSISAYARLNDACIGEPVSEAVAKQLAENLT